MTIFVIHNPLSFPNPNASVLSQYGSIFRFIPPQVVGGLVRPTSPLFLPPTCHRQAHGGNPNTMPVSLGKHSRALPFVRQRLPRPTRQAASHLTLHQFVCAITAIDFLKSFSPYASTNASLPLSSLSSASVNTRYQA